MVPSIIPIPMDLPSTMFDIAYKKIKSKPSIKKTIATAPSLGIKFLILFMISAIKLKPIVVISIPMLE